MPNKIGNKYFFFISAALFCFYSDVCRRVTSFYIFVVLECEHAMSSCIKSSFSLRSHSFFSKGRIFGDFFARIGIAPKCKRLLGDSLLNRSEAKPIRVHPRYHRWFTSLVSFFLHIQIYCSLSCDHEVEF